MDERIVQFRVGVMVLFTLIITAILMLLFGKMPKIARSTYELQITFPDAPGVTVDTPVRKSGVLIGRVTDVQLNDDEGTVLIKVAIDGNRKLHESDVCFINESILGDATLEFQQVKYQTTPDEPDRPEIEPPDAPDPVIKPGAKLEGRVRPNAMRVVSDLEGQLSELITAMTAASGDVSTLSRQVSKMIGGENDQLKRVIEKTELTLDSVRAASDNANKVLGDEEMQANLKQTLRDMPATLAETREALAGFQQTMSLADTNLRNMETFTKSLGDKGDDIFLKFDRSASRLERLLSNLTEFSEVLNSSEGTIGKLMRDPELYDNVNIAATNIANLTRELRPIVNDIRVFTDKIARHPETLGVGGAVRRSPGTK
jgi:phospholipid/cholesterol/gamma-HCH transport system substrate-binding protein